jgi:ATP-binding cassette, subfamily C, bacterial CydC
MMIPLRRLIGFLRPYLGEVILSVLCGVATVACGIGLLGTAAYVIAVAALHPSIAVLEVAIVGVRAFGIGRGVFRYLERLLSHSVNFGLLAELRVWFYKALEPLAPARLESYQSGDLLNRAIGDIETLENFYVRAVSPPLTAFVITIGITLFVGTFDFLLSFVMLLGMLAAGIGLPVLVRKLSIPNGQLVTQERARLSALLIDAIQGMSDLLAFGQEKIVYRRLRESSRALNSATERLARVGALGNAGGILLSNLTMWLILLATIPLIGMGRVDAGMIGVLALVVLSAFEAMTPLPQAAQHLEGSIQSAQRLFDLVDAQPNVKNPLVVQTAPESVDLLIQDLTFRYSPESEPVLAEINLHMEPGKKVALVGPSGAGKTTLGNLLLRFWDCPEGAIQLDGHDIRSYRMEDVRAQIAVVSQSVYLFSGTLRSNLTIAQPAASDEKIDEVIREVGLEELVSGLPNGEETWIGAQGLQLSGGERQRVAVARAMLKDASLILMDEPTASLDAITAQALTEAMVRVFAEKSILLITHSLIGMELFDEILVLKDGRIVERGKHDELIWANGWYAQAWELQRWVLPDTGTLDEAMTSKG